MCDKRKIDSFVKELDALLQGASKIAQSDSTEELKLVEKILKEDFSDESRLKQETKKRLLDKINKNKNSKKGRTKGLLEEGELNEEELSYASGGHAVREEGACSRCDCKRSRITISTAKCPVCGHSREEHL